MVGTINIHLVRTLDTRTSGPLGSLSLRVVSSRSLSRVSWVTAQNITGHKAKFVTDLFLFPPSGPFRQ
ncbi:hypothetical protein DY000_02006866 [Brassica cretica]|uniref:Uncharacterized protein n=1 Tax=Brassica cretica TaxID=69181 RepID=A0ABQ7BTK7_BRACR|nr:hypothetical protein DY000_02006866 [Brassica cretica]